MFKVISRLLLIVALCVPWATQAQGDTINSFPFACDFEDASDAAHWSFSNASNGWYIGTATNNTTGGSSALYVSEDNGVTSSYSGSACVSYAYLTFEFDAAGEYAVQFDWKCEGESTYDFLRVAVASASTALPTSYSSWTSTSVPSNFVAIDGGNKLNLDGTSWTTMLTTVSVPAAGVYRLLFVWRNDGSVYHQPPAAVDNIIITELTCPKPTALVALPSNDEIDISWNPGGQEAEWMVVVTSADDTVVEYVTDTFLTVSSLDEQTLYHLAVYAICDAGDTSFAATTDVRTTCSPLDSLPYLQNFDNLTTSTTAATGVPAPCWDAILTGTATYQTGSYVPQVYYSSTYAHSGIYCYRLYGVGYHMLPPMPVSLDSLQLTFWDYTTSTSYGLEVGVMEGSTFIPIEVITSPTSTKTEHTVYFGSYTGNSRIIAFRNYYTSSTSTYYSYHYIDDIEVKLIPSCPDIASHAVNTTASSARIRWNYNHDLGITPDEYEVSYGFASDGLQGATSVTATEPELVITGLEPDTSYIVSIATVCTDGNGEIYTFTFNTKSLPCVAWDDSGVPSSPEATYVVGTPGSSSVSVMPVNGDYNYSYCNHLILRSEISAVPSGTTYFSGIDFQYAGTAPMTAKTDCAIYMCHTSMTVCDNFADTGDLVLVYEGPLNCSTNDWNHFEFNRGVFAYNGTSNIIVAIVDNSGSTDANASFKYTQTSSSMTHRVFNNNAPYSFADLATVTAGNSMWRSNMRLTTGGGADCIATASCYPPYVFVDQDLAGDIEVSWMPGYQETSWDVEYRATGASNWTTVISATSTTSQTILMSDLQPNTAYEFRVVANCSDSAMATTVTYTTPCSFISIPYFYGFEDMATTSSTAHPNIPCWTHINNGSTYFGYPYVSSTAHESSRSLYWYLSTTTGTYGDYEIVVLPPVDVQSTSINSLLLDFWAKPTSTSYSPVFLVGVMSDPSDVNTFETVQTVNINNSSTDWMEYEVPLSSYIGTGRYVAIRANRPTSSWYAYLDDVSLDFIPLCPRVEDLQATYTSIDSITVMWSDTSDATAWYVEYDDAPFTPGSGVVAPTLVSDTVFTLEGLDSATTYYIYVYPDCPDGVYSRFISVTTLAASPATVPFFCDFENEGVNGWDLLGQGQTNYWIVDSAVNNGGVKSMYVTNNGFDNAYTNSTISYSYAIRVLNLSAPGEYAYTYDWKGVGESHYYDFTRVFVVPASESFDAGTVLGGSTYSFASAVAPSNWIELTQSGTTPNTLAQQSNWQTVTGTFHITNPGNYKLVFVWANDGSGGSNPPTAVDNVGVILNNCGSPADLTASYITSDSIVISWNGGDQTTWEVTTNQGSYVVNDTFFVADQLTANTEYFFRVRTICGADDTSLQSTINVYTSCGATPLPFFESFETFSSSTSDPLPQCWAKYTNYSTSYPYASTSYGHTGSKSMYMYSTSTTYSYMVLPQFNAPVDSLMISFWLYSSSLSYSLKVGVMTDPANVNTFTEVATVTPTATSVWQQYEVPLTSYTGTGNRVAIMSPNGITSYPYLDDLEVTRISSCDRVVDVNVSNVMTQSATVSWYDTVPSHQSWFVEYSNTDFTPGDGTITPIAVTDTFYTITGLDSSTVYYVYVYPDCEDVAPRGISFTTLAGAPAALPYSCNFENAGPNGWDFIQNAQNNYWVVGAPETGNNNRAMYVTDNGTSYNYSGSISYSFATRNVVIPAAGDYAYSFDWRCNGESSYDFIRAALVPAGTQLTAGSYSGFNNASAMPAGAIALDGGNRMNLQSNWQNATGSITITTPGTYAIVFLWRNDASVYNQPPAAIDNVQLAQLTCPRPQNITLANLTQTSADVSWTEPGSATEWQYQLDNGTLVSTTSNNCSLSNLSANTAYTFRVRSICGQGDTSFWTNYNFRTPCGYISLPYSQDFEAETTGSSTTGSAFANCWTRLNNGTSYGGYPYVSSSSSYNHTSGGSKGLYWYNSTTAGTYGDYQCIVLPPVDPSVSINTLQLAFWAKASSSSYNPSFQIGVMTDPNNISTFVGVDTVFINGNTSWDLFEVPLVSYTGNGQYVAIKADRATSSWYAYVDDIDLDNVPTCLKVTNIHASVSDMSSLTVDWTDYSNPQMWQVEYGQPGFAHGQGTLMTVSSKPAVIMGLDSATNYDVYVRPICSASDTGRWSMATLATAFCDGMLEFNAGSPSGTSYDMPVNNYWNYSLTETIIDSAELADAGFVAGSSFTGIAFSYAYSSPSTEKTDVNIWIQPTTKTVFSNSLDMEALSANAVLAYSGHLNCSNGWNVFQFQDTLPVTWDGHSNLLLIFDDNSGEYDGSSYVFNTSSCTGYKSISYYSDDYHPNVTSASDLSNWDDNYDYYQNRPTMRLISCGNAVCRKPNALNVSDVTYNTATINWNGNGDAFEVSYKTATEGVWPDGVVVNNANSYQITGLTPSTTYQYRVRTICDAAEGVLSDWVMATFVTDSLPCFAPSGMEVTGLEMNTATFDWTVNGAETSWRIHVWNTNFDQTYDVTTHPATITGLTKNTQYNAAVMAMCGGILESEASDTVSFTTLDCPVPTNVAVSNVTAHSATISWNGNAASYTLEYGSEGYPQGDGTAIANITGNSYELTDLYPGYAYDVYVMANCDAQNGSDWSTKATFTTLVGIDGVEGTMVTLYPNPTSNSTTITLSGVNGDVTIAIVDMNGRTVRSETLSCEGDCAKTMQVNDLAQGAYFVRISGENVNMVKKLVVK